MPRRSGRTRRFPEIRQGARHADGRAARRPGMSSIALERVEAPSEEARALIAELDAELSADYPPEQRHGLSVERVFQPGVLFFVARLDGEAVGCGGIALEGDWAEVKRMYVRPAARGLQGGR